MDAFNMFILTMTVLISSATAGWQVGVLNTDSFIASDGYTCGYAECRKNGPGPRLFHIQCKKQDQTPYECVYKGQPHGCNYYNSGHQSQYYA